MVPIVGGHLVVPGIDLQRIATRLKAHPGGQPMISLQAIEISYYEPRFRPARLRRALAAIMEIVETDRLLTRVEDLLNACLGDKLKALEAVDLAYDYLSLTSDLSSARNFLIAGMALKQAIRVIDEFIRSDEELGEMQSVIAFKATAELLAKELRAGNS